VSDSERKPPPEPKDTQDLGNPSADSFLRKAAALSEPPLSATEAAERRPWPGSRADLAAGQVVAKRYRLDKELGRGGMGVVWAATHLVTRRQVAIKFLKGSAALRIELRLRFLREARAASAVNHPNVVGVLDVFELEDETPVMVMELLSGRTLREKLTLENPLPLWQTASILLAVVEAVERAHALGIVHRDLKPENIFLVERDGHEAGVKVLDFGIAKLLGPASEATEPDSITGTGSMLGTPCYMAPEQTLGEKGVDHRADIWALGVIMYECLAGVRPVEGLGVGQVVMKLATKGIAPIDQVAPGLPKGATSLAMRMLAREPADRPQDLREVREVLALLVKEMTPLPLAPRDPSSRSPVEGDPREAPSRAPDIDTQAPQALPHHARRMGRRSVVASVAAGGVLVIAFASWHWSAHSPRPSPAPQLDEQASPSVAALVSVSPAPLESRETEALPAPASGRALAASPPMRDAGPPPSAGAAIPAQRARTAAPAFVAVTSDKPIALSAQVPTEAPSATPKPAPRGLAEKPPF
jgi:serine/threonine protein kinase